MYYVSTHYRLFAMVSIFAMMSIFAMVVIFAGCRSEKIEDFTALNLSVEYEHEPNNLPVGSDAPIPRLAWEVAGPRGVEQGAYRVVASKNREALESGLDETLESGNDWVWDSGRVESGQSVHLPWRGAPLEVETTYHWRVHLWEKGGKPGEWSKPASFTTAIPDHSTYWKGVWIGPNYNESKVTRAEDLPRAKALGRPGPLLRRDFTVDGEITNARLHVAGLGYYELYINGERVGERVLDPGISNYERTILYSTYDVTDLLSAGENAIGAALGRGWFGLPTENVWLWEQAPWWSDPQLLLQLNINFADGTSTSIVSNELWTMTDGPTRFDCLYTGEIFDARVDKPGWTESGYDASGWENAPVAEAPGGSLIPQRMPPVGVANTLEPKEIMQPGDGIYVFDLGQIIAGWVELTVEGPAGTVVTMTMGEKLHDDGTVNIETDHIAEPIQTDQYVLKGEGTEVWEPRFSYKGFRYVQVEGYPGEPDRNTLRGKHVHTRFDVNHDSRFECSNNLLNRIHENTQWAYRNNHHSLPTDTPKLEKNGWMGDAQITAMTGMYNYDMALFYTKWLRDIADSQLESGELPTIVPTSGWSYEGSDGWRAVQGPTPGWDAAYMLIPWWMYEFYGDKQLLETHYDGMKLYLGWLQEYADNHIVEVGLGDWGGAPLTGADSEVAITSTAYYYRFARVLGDAAALLGKMDEAVEWGELANTIRDTFNAKFFDEERGYYRTGAHDEYLQTSNVFPLAFGMVPGSHKEEVVGNLVHDIMETHGGRLNTATLGTKYLLTVLSGHGHHEVAYTVATQTDFPGWGHWIVNNRTSLLEFWHLDSRSWNHHFLGVIDEWFYKHLAGIQVGAPGFENIIIAPKPANDLDWVHGRVNSIRGIVESNWKLVGGGIHLDVTIPGNATASIEIPDLGHYKIWVKESGETIWDGEEQVNTLPAGIKSVIREDNRFVVKTGGGKYTFELQGVGE